MVIWNIALLVLRLVIGSLFIGHGLQKISTRFGGHGWSGTIGMMEQLGLRPARFWAMVSAASELGGGVLFVLGLLTPIAAAVLAGSMLMAIALVHGPRGLWNSRGGYEYNLVLLTVSVFLGLAGAGAYALDAGWFVAHHEVAIFLVALIIAVAGVVVGLSMRLMGLSQVSRAGNMPGKHAVA